MEKSVTTAALGTVAEETVQLELAATDARAIKCDIAPIETVADAGTFDVYASTPEQVADITDGITTMILTGKVKGCMGTDCVPAVAGLSDSDIKEISVAKGADGLVDVYVFMDEVAVNSEHITLIAASNLAIDAHQPDGTHVFLTFTCATELLTAEAQAALPAEVIFCDTAAKRGTGEGNAANTNPTEARMTGTGGKGAKSAKKEKAVGVGEEKKMDATDVLVDAKTGKGAKSARKEKGVGEEKKMDATDELVDAKPGKGAKSAKKEKGVGEEKKMDATDELTQSMDEEKIIVDMTDSTDATAKAKMAKGSKSAKGGKAGKLESFDVEAKAASMATESESKMPKSAKASKGGNKGNKRSRRDATGAKEAKATKSGKSAKGDDAALEGKLTCLERPAESVDTGTDCVCLNRAVPVFEEEVNTMMCVYE